MSRRGVESAIIYWISGCPKKISSLFDRRKDG